MDKSPTTQNRFLVVIVIALVVLAAAIWWFTPDQQQRRRNMALIAAVQAGDLKAAEAMLDAGADVNARDADGITTLMHAARGERPKLLCEVTLSLVHRSYFESGSLSRVWFIFPRIRPPRHRPFPPSPRPSAAVLGGDRVKGRCPFWGGSANSPLDRISYPELHTAGRHTPPSRNKRTTMSDAKMPAARSVRHSAPSVPEGSVSFFVGDGITSFGSHPEPCPRRCVRNSGKKYFHDWKRNRQLIAFQSAPTFRAL